MPTPRFSRDDLVLLRGAIEDSQFAIAVAYELETLSGFPTLAEKGRRGLCRSKADAIQEIRKLDAVARRIDASVGANRTVGDR